MLGNPPPSLGTAPREAHGSGVGPAPLRGLLQDPPLLAGTCRLLPCSLKSFFPTLRNRGNDNTSIFPLIFPLLRLLFFVIWGGRGVAARCRGVGSPQVWGGCEVQNLPGLGRLLRS